LIFASLIAVGFARIEVNQQLDGSMVEIIDEVTGTSPFRGNNHNTLKLFKFI